MGHVPICLRIELPSLYISILKSLISNPIGKEPYIVVFTPVKDKESLSLIVELPQNECHIDFGHTDIFFIDKKPVRKGKKRIKLLKLINNFLKSNGLIEV